MEQFEYPLSFEDWAKEFNVSSEFVLDTNAETEIVELLKETERRRKELIIKNAQLYNRSNQNKYIC